MATKNFPRRVKPNLYIPALMKRCVPVVPHCDHTLIDRSTIHKDMIQWCIANVGEQLDINPLQEARLGWAHDHAIGNWTFEYDFKTFRVVFWFKNKEDRMMFRLVWNDYC